MFRESEGEMNLENAGGSGGYVQPMLGGTGNDLSTVDDLIHSTRTGVCTLITGSPEASEALAHRIHSESGWRHGPFIIVDCRWPEAKVEAVLFGSLSMDPRADTAAPYPELGQAGTVFLKEVGLLSPALQTRLADALTILHARYPSRRLRRRLIASSSHPLLARLATGEFDERLFYRLNVVSLRASADC
jgi:two-component system response regulator HydG